MSNIFSFVFFLLGAFFFSFILWRRLKEDYHNEDIFRFTLVIFAALILGWWFSSVWAKPFSFWITILVPFAAGAYVHRRLGLRFFELIDALAPSWFTFLFFAYSGVLLLYIGRFGKVATNPEPWFAMAELILAFVAIVLYNFLARSYRKFSWYPSGKVGFAGLAAIGFYFLVRTGISVAAFFITPTVIMRIGSFPLSVEIFNAIMGLALVVLAFGVLYSRSGRRRV